MGEHPVPAGPLAVRWLAHELGPVQAGALTRAHVVVENAGYGARAAAPIAGDLVTAARELGLIK